MRWLDARFPVADGTRRGRLRPEQVAAARDHFSRHKGSRSRSASRNGGRNGGPPVSRLASSQRTNGGSRAVATEALVRARRGRERRRGRPNVPRRIAAVVGVVLLALIASVTALAVIGYSTAVPLIASTCTLENLRPIKLGQNSFVYASDGSLIGAVQSARNRQPVKNGAMSPWLPKATVAIEDRRFYEHGGIDLQGIARAALADLQAGRPVQGGSTITQQLVRNLYIGKTQDTLSRKLDEACIAVHLSEKWSKKRILQEYMNQVYYGAHAYGVEAAAETYFNRPASKLTIGQAALLAGLPQAPSIYDPFHHPDRAKARRNDVLAAMLVNGALEQGEYRRWRRQPLDLDRGHRFTRIRDPYFFDLVRRRLVARYGEKRVRGGGLTVQTTLNPKLQLLAKHVMERHLPTDGDPAAALVAINPANGRIKALSATVPGREKPLSFNLPADAHRQAGSSFKPFAYLTAMKEHVSPSSVWQGPPEMVIHDPGCETNGEPWDVHNYADESAGTMPLQTALAHSVNTIFAQVSVAVGPTKIAETAHEMGIDSDLQSVCSIALGTQPVTPLEMTNAYATFAANGIFRPATPLRNVRNPRGDVIEKDRPKAKRVADENDIALTIRAMEGVVTYGTGVAANIGRPVAGKTGTAEQYKDAWFCGIVPQLAVCVWLGYHKGEISLLNVEGVPAVAGGTIPAEIWHDFMQVAVANLPIEEFPAATTSGYDTFPQGSTPPAPPPAPAPAPAPAPSATPEPTDTTSAETTTETQPTETQPTETQPPTNGNGNGNGGGGGGGKP